MSTVAEIESAIGQLSTQEVEQLAAWLGLRPGDVHLTISSPGWAKHAWGCFFAPWIAEATIFVYDAPRFDALSLMDALRSERVTTFCAPPTCVPRIFPNLCSTVLFSTMRSCAPPT